MDSSTEKASQRYTDRVMAMQRVQIMMLRSKGKLLTEQLPL